METTGPIGFGALLRGHRLAAGLTQEELAERAGLSMRGVQDLERGLRRRPQPGTIRRLAEALQLGDTARTEFLGAGQAPASQTEGRGPSAPPLALPVPPTSFVGRGQELTELRRRLDRARLLTLVGPGGVGKTRLALEVARAVSSMYRDGVACVELAPVTDPHLVPHTLARVLGVRARPGQSILGTLVDALARRRLLLVLDNCEHFVAMCAELAAELLRGCPGISILATSREALGVAGEITWTVPPLTVPGAAEPETTTDLARHEAVQLFVDRAQAGVADFGLTEHNAPAIAAICRRLDGIPLALELAAARIRVLSPEQIAQRLEHALSLLVAGSRAGPARHQTVRTTIDWSYELLSEAERRLFERLSVFAGGWTLEAAEVVGAGGEIRTPEVLDLLARLVDKSLVRVERDQRAARYHLLDTLRQYGAERLEACGETERTRNQHAAYYTAWVEGLGPAGWGPRQAERRASVDREHENVRAALRWLIDRRQVEQAQRLGGAMASFWQYSGRLGEGRAWLEEILACPEGLGRTAARARALTGAGIVAVELGEYTAARPLLEAALTLGREVGDDLDTAVALYRLAQLAWFRREFGPARALAEDASVASRAAGQPVLDGYALWLAAQAAHDLGDPAAGTLAEEALAVATEAEYPIGMALALTTLGQGELQRGELAAARTLLERAVAMHGAAAFLGRLWSLVTLAWVATLQADLDRARTCLAEALAIGHDALGGRSRLVMPLEGFAQLAAAVGQPVRALRLAGAAAALRATHAAPPTPMEHTQLEHWLLRARATLGQLEAEMAWVSGQRLGPAQAVAEARALELGPAAAEPAPARSSRDSLTAREREVALLIGEGLGTRQIAERLVIAEGTARVHVERILAKLGLHSRAQLAAWAVRQALAPATSPDRLTPTLVESGRSRDRNQPEVGSRC